MPEIELTDHLGDEWHLLPCVFKRNKHGLVIMWVYVCKGPAELRHYQEIPLPVFTDWWEPC